MILLIKWIVFALVVHMHKVGPCLFFSVFYKINEIMNENVLIFIAIYYSNYDSNFIVLIFGRFQFLSFAPFLLKCFSLYNQLIREKLTLENYSV